jgi:hypothetical protein
MNDTATPYQMLYVSRLAPGMPYGVINDIVTVSRRANPERRITGVLLFDGERFGQLLEGSEAAVTALMTRISADPRHTDIVTLFSGVSGSPRHTRAWRSGYCEPHQLEPLAHDITLRSAALAVFAALVESADVE